MNKQIVHTCYGCKYYYRESENGEIEYQKPFSYRHCDIENPWDCDYFSNNGEPNVRVKKEEQNERDI